MMRITGLEEDFMRRVLALPTEQMRVVLSTLEALEEGRTPEWVPPRPAVRVLYLAAPAKAVR